MTRLTQEELSRTLSQEGYGIIGEEVDTPSTLSVADAKEMVEPGGFVIIQPRSSKYRNKRVVHHCLTRGILVFDSVGEFKRYRHLLALESAGIVSDLRLQVPFEILPSFTTEQGENVKGITYKADFVYNEQGNDIIEDFKGMRTDVFNLKWRMMQYQYGNLYELRLTSK